MTAGVAYFVNLLVKKRRELDGMPCPPMKNRWLGHLDIAGDCVETFPPNAHMHNWIPYIQKKHNMGGVFYIDWWPMGPRWIFMSDPEMTSKYITTGNSLTKSPLLVDYVNEFLGPRNLVSVDGQLWKQLRSISNPGFSASHLMTLVPYIIDASMVFHNGLRAKARTEELFQLEEDATKLTIDIIGKVVLDSDFGSQKKAHPIVQAFRKRVLLMPLIAGAFDFSKFELRRRFKVWLNGRELDRLIGEELDRKIALRKNREKAPMSFKGRNRSIIELALDAYQKEQAQAAGDKESAELGMDQTFRSAAIDSIKTFIFAGHDTTASTIAYMFYLLHLYPEVHIKVVKELDTVFSPDATPESIATIIKKDPYIINRLEYVTAVIKETLRMFPSASTLRYQMPAATPEETVYMIEPGTGRKLPLSGWNIWPTVTGHSHNEAYFPQPADFIPDRFIPSMTPFPEAKLFTPAGKDAWRPFEKGPRTCIGQELAMIESKIVVALSFKELDFVAEYDGNPVHKIYPVESHIEAQTVKSGAKRKMIEGHPAYQVLKGTAKPKDEMPGRVYFRKL